MPQSKSVTIFTHIAGWFLFFSLPIVFLSVSMGQDLLRRVLSLNYWLFYSFYVFLFYFNAYYLIPKLYLQKKYFNYFVIIIALFIAVCFFKPFDHLIIHGGQPVNNMPPPGFPNPPDNFRKPPEHKLDIISIILFVMIWALGMAIRIIEQWRISEQRAARAEADKANAELSFLKAQINPHFLFNTLNNIYSMAVTQNENTAASIMKLSKIMRYVTDDASKDFVSLNSEVECISDYIDLQRLRLNKKIKVGYTISGNLENKRIAPLILMTFIENVFKYGISSHEASTIIIKLSVENNTVTFYCQNKLFPGQRKIERTGIGIKNTRERLAHLYPNKHSLNLTQENGLYVVQLTLQV